MATVKDWAGATVDGASVIRREGAVRYGNVTRPVWIVRCRCGVEFARHSGHIASASNGVGGARLQCASCTERRRRARVYALVRSGGYGLLKNNRKEG